MARMGQGQQAGLSSLQSYIDGADGQVQKGVMDFISSPEGQDFFTSSQDPIGAIKGYLQVSQAATPDPYTLAPGQKRFSGDNQEVAAVEPMEIQTAKGFMSLADLNPEESRMVSKAFLSKMTAGDAGTQKEDAIRYLIDRKIIDEDTGQKWLAGVIHVDQPRDAAGRPLGPPIAVDFTEVANGGRPQITVIGGNKGGPAGDEPDTGAGVDTDTGEKVTPSGDIIFGAGPVAGVGSLLGGVLGNIRPELAATEYTKHKTALSTIFSDVTNLLNVNKRLASDVALSRGMVDKSGILSNPAEQGQALLGLHNLVDRRLAEASIIVSSSDPKYTGEVKAEASQELVALKKLQRDLPTREDLEASMMKFNMGEGSIQQGITEGAGKLGAVVTGAEEVGAAAGKAVEGQEPSSGQTAPKAFKTEQEAAAAAKAGTLKPGDRVIIGGRSATYTE
jgi:hypothetical protein